MNWATMQVKKRVAGIAAVVVTTAVLTALLASPSLFFLPRVASDPQVTSAQQLGETGLSSNPVIIYRLWGPWNFTATLDRTDENTGGSIHVLGLLTYFGTDNTVVSIVKPTLELSVLDKSGGVVWRNYADFVTFPNVTVAQGESHREEGQIPISTLPPGLYSIQIEPPLYSFPARQDIGAHLLITTSFTQVANPSTPPVSMPCISCVMNQYPIGTVVVRDPTGQYIFFPVASNEYMINSTGYQEILKDPYQHLLGSVSRSADGLTVFINVAPTNIHN